MAKLLLIERFLYINREADSILIYRAKAKVGGNPYLSLLYELTLYERKLIILEDDNLRTDIIRENYNILLTVHPGRNKTKKIINLYY